MSIVDWTTYRHTYLGIFCYSQEGEIRMIDWRKAEEHLKTCEREYAKDTAGYLVLSYVINPLRDRLNKGERTRKLFKEIMETQV